MRLACASCEHAESVGPGGTWPRCCDKPTPRQVSGSSRALVADSKEPRSRYRSKTEAAYAQHLETRKRAGQIKDWRHETIKLRLANGVWFLPDFPVVLPDDKIELHEVKGGRKGRYYTREKGRMKVRIAADQFPMFRVCIVWPLGNGAWGREDQ